MIETEELSVHYGSITAIRDASVSIPERKITAIVGPSGCGKSSFLSALNRMTDLIPSARISGKVLFRGENIYDRAVSAVELRRRVGMIFQAPNPFPTSIRRNLHLALREHGVRGYREREAIAGEALRNVGLWEEVQHRLDSFAPALSGGQQQRLCIARAIAIGPQTLLMDEPCSALDPVASAHIESLIRRLRKEYTVVIVTHNLAQARRLADYVAVFWVREGAGTIIEQGAVDEVFDSPRNAVTAAYLAGQQG